MSTMHTHSQTTTELRAEAIGRLGTIAGYDERLDVHLTMARPRSVQVLIRQALRASIGDELLLAEVRSILGVAAGRAAALDDAMHQGGLREPTPETGMDIGEFERAVSEGLA